MYSGLVRHAGLTLILRLSHLLHFMRLANDGTTPAGDSAPNWSWLSTLARNVFFAAAVLTHGALDTAVELGLSTVERAARDLLTQGTGSDVQPPPA